MTDLMVPAVEASEVPAARSGNQGVVRRFMRDRFAVAGLLVLALMTVLAVFAPVIAQHDPEQLFVGVPFEEPSGAHWFGTDDLGRDNASRIVYGTRVALRVALEVAAITLLIAVPLGLMAGFAGGVMDFLLMRLVDAVQAVPPLIFALAVASAFDLSFNWALFGVGVSLSPSLTRIVRAETLAVREETFIEASVAVGSRTSWILLRRVLPNIASPIIVQTTIFMGVAILAEAGLSILGVGLSPGSAAWGSMLSDSYTYIQSNAQNVLYPGIAIAVIVLAFNLVGDGLRDALGLDTDQRFRAKTRLGLTVVAKSAPIPATTPAATRTNGETGPPPAGPDVVLEVRSLTVDASTRGERVTIVDDIGFTLERGQVLGLVGESGSGKTVSSLAIMRLLPSPPFTLRRGEILFEGRDLMQASMAEMRGIRGNEIAMVFQDPMVSLNPAHRVGRQIAESVRLHRGGSDRDAQRRAVELLDHVGIPDARSRATSYPHELSGGMRQRAMLAMALACSPKVLIADEPTTALDVTIQAQILELLRELRREYDLSVILVTHDLGVVADICDQVLVMYAGQVVEHAPADQVFRHPEHPYTEALLQAMPRLSSGDGDILPIAGRVPTPGHHPAGCRFHPRCAHATELCRGEPIELRHVALSSVRCVHSTTAAGRG